MQKKCGREGRKAKWETRRVAGVRWGKVGDGEK